MTMIMKILLGVLAVLVFVYVYGVIFGKARTTLFSSERDATQPLIIPATRVPYSGGMQYAYSFWVFIKDWAYRYGEPKAVIYQGDADGTNVNPGVWLFPSDNKLMIGVQTYAEDGSGAAQSDMNPIHNLKAMTAGGNTCDVDNIPLQRWVNIAVSLNGRNMDVYVNGKLNRTCFLQGVPKLSANSALYVTPDGGFSGNISKLMYYGRPITPAEAAGIYAEGPDTGFGWINRVFSVFKLKVTLIENGKEEHSFTI